MYSHGTVWDSKPDEGEPRLIEVGNAIEAVARNPERYFSSKEAADAAADRAVRREEAAKAARDAADAEHKDET